MISILNNSVPNLIENISVIQRLPTSSLQIQEEKPSGIISLAYNKGEGKNIIFISEKDRGEFIDKLKISSDSLKKMRKGEREREIKYKFKKPSLYAKISNKMFLGLSSSITRKGQFSRLNNDLKKANIFFMLNTYLSMAFFSTLIAFFIGILAVVFIMFFNVSLNGIGLNSEGLMLRFAKFFWIMFALPLLTFICFYFYPATEKDSIRRKINIELPFVTIHMSAIAGSGIEPTQIFRIISMSREYKSTSKELKKVINQVNVYGYDLVNALKNSASFTASDKLAELFNGLATTISTGGDLSEFLDKRSETLLFEYKLDREKYNKTAETFMDIYISIVIAAPMIMMLLLILASVMPGSTFGLSIQVMTTLIIAIVAFLNVLFVVFLQLKQKEM